MTLQHLIGFAAFQDVDKAQPTDRLQGLPSFEASAKIWSPTSRVRPPRTPWRLFLNQELPALIRDLSAKLVHCLRPLWDLLKFESIHECGDKAAKKAAKTLVRFQGEGCLRREARSREGRPKSIQHAGA